MNKNTTFKLGRSNATILYFQRVSLEKPTLPKREIITKKLIIGQ
jgi:hypothetical protein